jgi:hypothetical protein
MAHSFSIGTTQATLTNLANLTTPVPEPKSTYRPYADVKPLASGGVRGVGFPVATWYWDILTRAQRDQLRIFCSGQSAAVWIRTKTMDSSDTYRLYQAVMVWATQEEEREMGHRRTQLQITFQAMVEVAEP